jgi:galactose mutarotase-like enzyme
MNDTADRHSIADGGLRATILAQGAELCSLRDDRAGEMLWQAGPAWPRHAPVLFPIVGRLGADRLLHHGGDYRLTQHGFARDRRFSFVRRDAAGCRLELCDDVETMALYPFRFRFTLDFAVADGELVVRYTATNTGDGVLPVNMGAHPAFRWPLADGVAKSDHMLTFSADEPEPMPRVSGGLLSAAIYPSVIHDRVLKLDEALFAADALILPHPHSRSVRFTAPGAPGIAPGIEMRWSGFPSFGIWMRPPGDFLCLEPWHGMASPADWQGPIEEKPGIALLAPGMSLEASYGVRILPKDNAS